MKLKIWLNSGANIRSRVERVVDISELGYSLDEKYKEIKNIAFERATRGFVW